MCSPQNLTPFAHNFGSQQMPPLFSQQEFTTMCSRRILFPCPNDFDSKQLLNTCAHNRSFTMLTTDSHSLCSQFRLTADVHHLCSHQELTTMCSQQTLTSCASCSPVSMRFRYIRFSRRAVNGGPIQLVKRTDWRITE